MQTVHDILRDRLLEDVIAQEFWPDTSQQPIDKKAMEELQWDSEEWQFILRLMKNRMSMGGYRYGPTKSQKRREFDNIADVFRRLNKYKATGNMEHLVDAANIIILACLKEDHPNFHFKSIDDGEHAKRL